MVCFRMRKMVKIVFNVDNKNLYFFLFGIVVIILFGFVMAYNPNFPSENANPAIFGHSADEVLVKVPDSSPSGIRMTLQTAIDGGEFGAWRKNGSIVYYNNGNVGIGTANPSTKLEVNGQVKAVNTLKTFVGGTTATYTGAGVGGYAGGDTKCNAQYPGSRMCISADFINGLPTAVGWYSTFISVYTGGSNVYRDCNGWTSSQYYIANIWSGSSPNEAYCSSTQNILCCS